MNNSCERCGRLAAPKDHILCSRCRCLDELNCEMSNFLVRKLNKEGYYYYRFLNNSILLDSPFKLSIINKEMGYIDLEGKNIYYCLRNQRLLIKGGKERIWRILSKKLRKRNQEIKRIEEEERERISSLRKELKKNLGKRVVDLPEDLRKKLAEQFPLFDNGQINNAIIQTWEDFISKSPICYRGTEDNSFWWKSLQKNPYGQNWISNDICVLKVNVLDLSEVKYERGKINFLSLIRRGEPALIVDADSPSFGKAYVVLETNKRNKTKLLAGPMEYIKAMKYAVDLDIKRQAAKQNKLHKRIFDAILSFVSKI